MAEERFWSKVNKTPTCWLWTGGCFDTGYGAFSINNNNMGSHKYSYELHNGKVPKGLFVRHSCDNPPCVNPVHLSIGTPADNSRDMVERDRQAKGAKTVPLTRPRGSKHWKSKLTEDDIREIRILRGFGFTLKELGNLYQVHFSMISYILKGKNWSHI